MNSYGTLIATDTLKIDRLLPGPIERIWEYLVDPALRKTWLAAGEMSLVEDGDVELIFNNNTLTPHGSPAPAKYAEYSGESKVMGRILLSEPPYRLWFTWFEQSGESSEVRFNLSQQGENVLLELIHSRLPSRDYLIGVSAGWHTHLDIMLACLDNRLPEGFWDAHTRLEAEYETRMSE